MKIENEIYQHLRVFLFLIFVVFFFLFSLFGCFWFHHVSSPSTRCYRSCCCCCHRFGAQVGNAVNITEFNVPSSYVIEDEENPGTLILDCAYESEPNEKGVVLKWLLNGTLIYQWIPDRPPAHSFVSIQSHPNDLMRCIFFSVRVVSIHFANYTG